MKFLGNIWVMIILKVTNNPGFTLSLKDTAFENPQGGSIYERSENFQGTIEL